MIALENAFPLIEELDPPLSPLQAFMAARDEPFLFFLDSGMDPQKLGRFSFIGFDPFLLLKSKGERITIRDAGEEREIRGDPFDVIGRLLEDFRLSTGLYPIPLVGGAVGYFGYDLGRFIERLPSLARDDIRLPECFFGFYDAVFAFDNLKGRAFLVSTGFPETGKERGRRAFLRLRELKEKLRRKRPYIDEFHYSPEGKRVELRSNFTHEGYLEAVERAREYIIAGDIFQVNLSQRFEADLLLHPFDLYLRLRTINPAPFACYLDLGEGMAILSSSPERFLRLRGDLVETRPIKGTRPRGRDEAEDRALAQNLLASVKDRAEHVMIVDLERNDLGKVCRFGTVKVSELMVLETYPTVFHLVSTVEGRLRPGKTPMDLLRACFPGGSITGAPKVRAMEIIEELEPTRRSVYTGSIGYLSFTGDLDLNIVIRTIIIAGGKAYFQVGGGIVYDSDPEGEYRETLDKAKALIHALRFIPEPVEVGR